MIPNRDRRLYRCLLFVSLVIMYSTFVNQNFFGVNYYSDCLGESTKNEALNIKIVSYNCLGLKCSYLIHAAFVVVPDRLVQYKVRMFARGVRSISKLVSTRAPQDPGMMAQG